jgi:tetratricopeptide (TPR) repeat protein/transcriptional regulator with XRE-family HTH domain
MGAEGRTFGQLLHQHRGAAGLSQEELAERTGLSARAISDLERGVSTRPRPKTIRQLAQVLNLEQAEQSRFEETAHHRDTVVAAQGPPRPPAGKYLGGTPPGPLVARTRELDRLLDLAAAGRATVVTGEPGVGKTRLAQEVARCLRERGFLVAAGRCYEGFGLIPYYPFLEVLASVYAAAPSTLQADAVRRWPFLSRLLPDQVDSAAPRSSYGPEEQLRLRHAVTSFLQVVATETPVALLLDDLHWADAASLELLRHIVRYSATSRIFLLGLYRDVEVGRRHRLRAVLQGLTQESLVERIVLQCFDQGGTAELMAATLGTPNVSAEFAALIQERTGGNPFFVQEVLRALVERGDVRRDGDQWARLTIEEMAPPETVRQTIGERVGRLPQDAQAALQTASVLGQTFRFDDLGAIGQQEGAELEQAMDAAMQMGLLQEVGADHYAFNHVLVQQALYAELSRRQKRRLHRAAGEALEQRTERDRNRRAAEVARHFLRGGDPARALPHVMRAGDRAEAVFAHEEAEGHYRSALHLSRDLYDPVGEARARHRLGTVLTTLARYGEALHELELAQRGFEELEDLDGVVQAMAAVGRAQFARGAAAEAVTPVTHLIERVEGAHPSPVSPASLASLYLAHAYLAYGTARYEEMERAARQAAELAQAARAVHIEAEATVQRAMALVTLNRLGEAKRLLEDATWLSEPVDDLELLQRGLRILASVYEDLGESEQCLEQRRRAVAVSERLGDPNRVASDLSNLGGILQHLGRLEEARTQYERSVTLFRALPSSYYAALPLGGLSVISLMHGDLVSSWRFAEESLAIAERVGNLEAMANAATCLAYVELIEGRPEEAAVRLEGFLARPEFVGLSVPYLRNTFPRLIEAHVELENLDRAEELANEGVRQSRAAGDRFNLCPMLRAQGLVLARRGRLREAEHALEEAAQGAKASSMAYHEASTLFDWGRILAQMGDREKARQRLEEARGVFERFGAAFFVRRTDQILATVSA